MSVSNSVFLALMELLAAKQPIAAGALIDAMEKSGNDSVEVRRAIQLAFERGRIRLDDEMRVVIIERELVAA
ncbi:hypothetical protein M8037_22135 [Sinorhizobium meliloti]|uniref:hypothetical protein n=1 Tax=Rhizobium meliloti TaxID=382 RepID=UPI002073C8C0|nr:hypothetical protein [Sinorhizobium meliloti]MCM5691427.1 hypothetical protein [Sinorhizobium meliloti]